MGLNGEPNSKTFNRGNVQFWMQKLREVVGHDEGLIEHKLKG